GRSAVRRRFARLDQAGRAAARHRAGRRNIACADARLYECRSARGDAAHRAGHVLQPQPAAAVDEGRIIGPRARTRAHGNRLRPRHAAGVREPARADLPSRHGELLSAGAGQLPCRARCTHCRTRTRTTGRKLHDASVRSGHALDRAESGRGGRGNRTCGRGPGRRRALRRSSRPPVPSAGAVARTRPVAGGCRHGAQAAARGSL
ncbi:MAG: Phosphoribosyl-AMP cyclohydrolase / Phosphoribosyl-ATP pyrophosphatase, partial [uncultured Lysobacter sp.]